MPTRTRGYLPHQDVSDGTYFVTFRLHDSLPQSVLLQYRLELETKRKMKIHADSTLLDEYESKIESYLDASYGECCLSQPEIAALLINVLRNHDEQWYFLHAYTIMPNHVHVLFSLNQVKKISEIVGNWKGSTSFYANKILSRSGKFWQREYFEKLVRSQRQFEFTIRYIFRNPVKAGLCEDVFKWPWTRSSPEIEYLLRRFFV